MSPPKRDRPAPTDRPTPHTTSVTKSNAYYACPIVDSRQVNWLTVHRFITPVLNQVDGYWPLLGTPAWCSLSHDDPRKWCALLDAAQHWALRLETEQQASAEASHAISAAEDWTAIANAKLRHARAIESGAHIPRAVS